MISSSEALKLLREGNKRHVSGLGGRRSRTTSRHRRNLILGQQPFAIVLGCADSRVAPEIVFDQGPGDLFVVRVAGNIVTPAQAGSIEYAIQVLGTKLVVVLGHSQCGAVQAALDEINQSASDLSPNLRAVVDHICTGFASDQVPSPKEAELENIRCGMTAIEEFAPADVQVVGARYDIGTGQVGYLND